MYFYSKYNIDFIDENEIVVVNLLTSSIVRFERKKFEALKVLDLENCFSDQEIAYLLDMGFINEHGDEYSFICEKRKKFLKDQTGKSFHITILTTSDCNARCYYCYENGINKKHMTLETAAQVYEYIKKNFNGKFVYINWFGGEPLYNKEIIDYISSALRNDNIDFSSSLVTNAYLIDENIDNIIDLWKVKRVQITIDGIGEKYNRIKKFIYDDADDAFNKVIHNIDWLIKHHIKISLRINFNPIKVEEAKQVIEYIHNRFGNPPELYVYCAWIIDKHVSSPKNFKAEYNPILELYTTLLNCNYITRIEEMGIHPRMLNCSIYWKGMSVVDVDGYLYKCQHGIMDGARGAFGSVDKGITNQNNVTTWENLEYPYEECKNCLCLPICQGGCKYRALHDSKEDVCIPIKNCIKDVVKLFYFKTYKEELP